MKMSAHDAIQVDEPRNAAAVVLADEKTVIRHLLGADADVGVIPLATLGRINPGFMKFLARLHQADELIAIPRRVPADRDALCGGVECCHKNPRSCYLIPTKQKNRSSARADSSEKPRR